MTVNGMKQPVPGRYSWDGERTLRVEYQLADVQQAYREAAKAYKDDVVDRIKRKILTERAGPSMLGAVPDELPAGEKFQVGISDQPRMLILNSEQGASQTYLPAD
jgi:hypothetical protein